MKAPLPFDMRAGLPWRAAVAAAAALSLGGAAGEEPGRGDFASDIAPLLVRRCLECHSGPSPEGGLRLSDADSLGRGGESGPVIRPGDAAASLLWQRVAADEMPPKRPLTEAEKRTLAAWIDGGGEWLGGPLDPFSLTTESRAGREFWSLTPVRDVPLPTPDAAAPAGWVRGPVDAFVLERLRAAGLRPATAADPRTLVRRVCFDLVGLPPTPEQVEAFAADPSDEAYGRLVDDLLDSPAYGERWGRHWLDVVRFGESDGYERNVARENAWPYRDWVIDALNDDLPYDRFVRMQLVGDLLDPGPAGAAATGFWVAGAHNTVVGGSKRMQQLARQDEFEEVIGTIGQTFVGLTLQCARCHDHKFDPVSQADYYRLASAISGLGHGERTVSEADDHRALADLDARLEAARKSLAAIDAAGRERAAAAGRGRPLPPAPLARWEFDGDLRDAVGGLHGVAVGNARTDAGALVLDGRSFVEIPPLPRPLRAKTLEAWVQLDGLGQRGGGVISVQTAEGAIFDAVVFGEREPGRWMAGSDNFSRSGSFRGSDEVEAAGRPVHVAIVYEEDGTIIGYRDGAAYGSPHRVGPLQPFPAGESRVLLGLRHKPAGGDRFLTGRIERAAVYDRALSAAEIAASAAAGGVVSEEALLKALSDAEREERARLVAAIAETTAARERQAGQATRKVYSLVPGRGEATRLLARGDPDAPGETVSPGSTAAIPALAADFGLPADAAEAQRRLKLADWITHPDNPLFARVIVNRVWHHHFGTGIVDTPSDFGFNGGRPSHPDLLDHLAADFRRQGHGLKRLHRVIVTSSTYRQSSRLADADPAGPRIDADNRLLWRGGRRRLEAESLRDAMLAVSGVLDASRGGPGYRDVSVRFVNGTTYYEPLDASTPAFFRRTIYRFSPRGDRPALLETFDCPDPSATTPRRSVTTTPLQALALLNDELVLRLADAFATRVRDEAGADVAAQVAVAWRRALGRGPDAEERRLAESLAADHGLAAVCRGLFNVGEFVVID